jgi:ADP-heptose:LPS heptosyltransferase
MESSVWIISSSDLDVTDMELKRVIMIKANVPKQLPHNVALRYIKKYPTVQGCKNPYDYFKDTNFSKLFIRDAGIGDLLLLEPIIRKTQQQYNFDISLLTRFPDVLDGSPFIKQAIETKAKDNTSPVDFKQYDDWVDYRSYSETHRERHALHRTDVYNTRANLELTDIEKEPRIYLHKTEKSDLKKKKGKVYVGVQVDASHSYRKYDRGLDLIKELLKNSNYVPVILGDKKYIENPGRGCLDYQGKTSIREAMNIIRDLDYMIAVDSGLMHVALSFHVPTVCIFSIISPHLRLKYFTGPRREVTADIDCVGCGNFHMSDCKHGSKKDDTEYVAPCMDIKPATIISKMEEMESTAFRRIFTSEAKTAKKVNIITKKNATTLTMPLIVQNEEKNLPRFIENVINHPSIGRVIAIDGGSTDKTVQLLEKAGAEVYVHPYIKNYHEQQAMQRNISCSYCRDGENILIMDIDECFSDDLSDYLPVLAASQDRYGLISRRTFEYYKDIKNPLKQIKDYPDWQPRYYKWDRKYKFVGGAHHITLNCPEPVKIKKDIIHFEREGKSREAIEQQWSTMMDGVKKYR